MPVLDALNASSERTLDGDGRIRVRRDVSVAIGSRLAIRQRFADLRKL